MVDTAIMTRGPIRELDEPEDEEGFMRSFHGVEKGRG